MINGKTVLAIIPARGGSKGVLRKNIRSVGGKPLIAWTIEEAKKSKFIDRLIVTSEDEEILEVARSLGCEVPFKRPLNLALDDTPGIDPVLHAMKVLPKYDYIVLLQPTSPLRSVEDIDGCLHFCLQNKANACVTVTDPDKSPYWMFTMKEEGFLVPLIQMESTATRRQDLPKTYALNGAVYIAKCDWLLVNQNFIGPETVAYAMPRERSIDIDSEQDIQYLDFILLQRIKNK
jgi:CMP-N,N'-diacetyllegionaminic acid synthase